MSKKNNIKDVIKNYRMALKTSQVVDDSIRDRNKIHNAVKEFYKKKGIKAPKILSAQRPPSGEGTRSANHFIFSAADYAADKHADELLKYMQKKGFRTVDEREMISQRKSKKKASIGRGVLHFDLRTKDATDKQREVGKHFKFKNYQLKKGSNFVFKKEDRKDKEDREFKRGKYKPKPKPKKKVVKKIAKLVAKKSLKKNISGYSITPEELKKLKNKYAKQPYFKFMDALEEFKTR